MNYLKWNNRQKLFGAKIHLRSRELLLILLLSLLAGCVENIRRVHCLFVSEMLQVLQICKAVPSGYNVEGGFYLKSGEHVKNFSMAMSWSWFWDRLVNNLMNRVLIFWDFLEFISRFWNTGKTWTQNIRKLVRGSYFGENLISLNAPHFKLNNFTRISNSVWMKRQIFIVMHFCFLKQGIGQNLCAGTQQFPIKDQ